MASITNPRTVRKVRLIVIATLALQIFILNQCFVQSFTIFFEPLVYQKQRLINEQCHLRTFHQVQQLKRCLLEPSEHRSYSQKRSAYFLPSGKKFDKAGRSKTFEVVPVEKSGGTSESWQSRRKDRSTHAGVSHIKSIMHEYVNIPSSNGMKVLYNVSDLERGASANIVIRNITEIYWKKAIDLAETPNMSYQVCAVGTPGIGKSKTTAILIRLLLQRNRTVVYRIRTVEKDGWVYEFKPTEFSHESKSSSVQVKVDAIPENEFHIDLLPSLTDDPSSYYIVDPGKTKEDCCPNIKYRGKFILVSSPDECHWGGSEFEKKRDDLMGKFLYYPLWTLEELLLARPYMQAMMTSDEVVERYRQVGGVPRHIFASIEDHKVTLDKQTAAVGMLTTDQLENIVRKEYSIVQTMSDKQRKSLVLGFGLSDDGVGTKHLVPISQTVVEKIVNKHIRFLWNKMTSLGIERGTSLGWQMFESFCRYCMIGSQYTSTSKECVSRKELSDSILNEKTLGGCKSIEFLFGNIIEAAKDNPMIIFHSADPKYPLIDFVYQKDGIFHVFQVTLGQTHTADPFAIRKLAKAVGGPQFLQLYISVPSYNFQSFKTAPVNPVESVWSLVEADIFVCKDNDVKTALEREFNAQWTIQAFMIKDPSKIGSSLEGSSEVTDA